jgi:hypothetical protein
MSVTAAAALKLDKVLESGLKVFKRRIVALLAFSTRFQAAELAKDKSLQVPFVPLDATASADWNPATGYSDGNFAVQARAVPVNKRKFQVLSWQSGDLLGLPMESLAWAMELKMDKLAYDVIADVLSVITAANYGAAIHTEVASAFTPDDVRGIANTLDGLNWPESGRSAVLHQDYVSSLTQDEGLKFFQNAGNDDALRRGVVGTLAGINVMKGVNFPGNGENLVGCVAMPSAILVANAPVAPDAEVLSQLQDYRVVTDPETQLTLTYRAWGNADLDKCKRVVEFAYGYAKGDEAQLKRLVSA